VGGLLVVKYAAPKYYKLIGETDPQVILNNQAWAREVEVILDSLLVPEGGSKACIFCKGRGSVTYLNAQAVQMGASPEQASTRRECAKCQGKGRIGSLI
jgi:hypothetical protein